jgi:diaminohydroxyphosphoribosylaminopyrimidine deaminase/5-amino-6-(5-phosphoribosylamino)uracil reductase
MPSASTADEDRRHMGRALELAWRGEGRVEPNPMVGCVLVRAGQVIGEGWHRQFGAPHAEIEALNAAAAAGLDARGATAYVTLEPCCRHGKTPPCTQALLAAGVERVVAGSIDPNPAVNGQGLAHLAAGGVAVEHDVCGEEAANLVAPFAKLVTRRRPWVIAKWAMSRDGKLAALPGESRWISGEASRAVVHNLRGRVDGILVGSRTAQVDNPLLTARPPGPRTPLRIVLDSQAALSVESRVVQTANEVPVLVGASGDAPVENCRRLREHGVEVWQSSAQGRDSRLFELLDELGRRQFTNLLVEGGAEVIRSLFDLNEIDEIHVFVAPRVIGGEGPSLFAGERIEDIAAARGFRNLRIERLGDDQYISGRRYAAQTPGETSE